MRGSGLAMLGSCLLLGPALSGQQRLKPAAAAVPGAAAAHPSDPHGNCLDCHPHGATAQEAAPPVAQKRVASGAGELPDAKPTARSSAPAAMGSATVCAACHQGSKASAGDRAARFPAWTGTGSSHLEGPIQERGKGYVRIVDLGPGRRLRLVPGCTGCHDVHAKDDPARLHRVGFDARGQVATQKRGTVAQLCFGCHAGQEAVRLTSGASDLGALFLGKGSAHRPGATALKRPDLPSLRGGKFQGALDCTSCHGSPEGSGSKGPHVSPFRALLKASYGGESTIGVAGDHTDDLCLTCHDKYSLYANQSFPLHAQHLKGFTGRNTPSRGGSGDWGPRPGRSAGWGLSASPVAGVGQTTPCATCHDPHGTPRNGGLVAFDKFVVSRASVGVIDFRQSEPGHGTCTLRCHGYDHVQTRY